MEEYEKPSIEVYEVSCHEKQELLSIQEYEKPSIEVYEVSCHEKQELLSI